MLALSLFLSLYTLSLCISPSGSPVLAHSISFCITLSPPLPHCSRIDAATVRCATTRWEDCFSNSDTIAVSSLASCAIPLYYILHGVAPTCQTTGILDHCKHFQGTLVLIPVVRPNVE